MHTRLVDYAALTATQQQHVSAIEVHPEQLPFLRRHVLRAQ